MIHEIVLPKLAQSMNGAVLGCWRVTAGDQVKPGDVLCEIVVDKVTLEVESEVTGVIRLLCARPGDVLAVGDLMAIAADRDMEIPEALAQRAENRPARDFSCARASCRLPQGKAEPLSPMRTIIAERMSRSARTAPHFFVTTIIDMGAALEFRATCKKEKIRFSVNDLLIKACALALVKFPRVGSIYTSSGYRCRERINVGFAAAAGDDGLLVPVVRNADRKSVPEIAAETRELISRVRKHKLTPDDYGDSIFTVSNLGTFEVDEFSAIINPGESAILAVGKTVETPCARKGEIVIRPLMKITLSSDHRTIDGVLAARFNACVKSLMEKPEEL